MQGEQKELRLIEVYPPDFGKAGLPCPTCCPDNPSEPVEHLHAKAARDCGEVAMFLICRTCGALEEGGGVFIDI